MTRLDALVFVTVFAFVIACGCVVLDDVATWVIKKFGPPR